MTILGTVETQEDHADWGLCVTPLVPKLLPPALFGENGGLEV